MPYPAPAGGRCREGRDRAFVLVVRAAHSALRSARSRLVAPARTICYCRTASRRTAGRRGVPVWYDAVCETRFSGDRAPSRQNEGKAQLASEATGVSGLAGRYATALFDLADQDKVLDQVAA